MTTTRPPGFVTRTSSAKATSGSRRKMKTRSARAAAKMPAGKGKAWASPEIGVDRQSALPEPLPASARRVRLASSPMIRPPAPTRAASDGKAAPWPQPRSKTVPRPAIEGGRDRSRSSRRTRRRTGPGRSRRHGDPGPNRHRGIRAVRQRAVNWRASACGLPDPGRRSVGLMPLARMTSPQRSDSCFSRTAVASGSFRRESPTAGGTSRRPPAISRTSWISDRQPGGDRAPAFRAAPRAAYQVSETKPGNVLLDGRNVREFRDPFRGSRPQAPSACRP